MAVVHAHHPVALRGPSPLHPGAPAVLVDLQVDDFVDALAAGIRRTAWPRFGWPAAFPFGQLASVGAPRQLYQAIHRRFNLVLLDTHCAAFGTPRLDPRRIESAGFVVRRWVGPDARAGTPAAPTLAHHAHWQAWRVQDGDALGWQGFASAAQFDADPDPARRPLPRTGNAAVDAALAARSAPLAAETAQRLYPLSPEVCEHAQRTLLFGLVPASETQRTLRAAAVDYAGVRAPGPARAEFVEHLSPYLRRSTARALPGARGVFDASWLRDDDLLEAHAPDPSAAALQRAQFAALIRQLALEFDLGGPRGEAIAGLLDELTLADIELAGFVPLRTPFGAAAFLKACARVVRDPAAPAVRIPDEWSAVPEGWTERFVDAALGVLESRSAEARTLEGRYDDADALFGIRAFVRVKGEAGCPSRLVWSDMTPLYRIAPWYASTGMPQARIALPSIAAATQMKPSVAFDLPPELQSLLARNSPKGLLGGDVQKGSELGVGWLCSFSIPIITLCAFIALNIVLGLLDFVFRWIPLVKICLPIPRRK